MTRQASVTGSRAPLGRRSFAQAGMKLVMLVCWEDATRKVDAKEELLWIILGYRSCSQAATGLADDMQSR
jgi:hypothetical protein